MSPAVVLLLTWFIVGVPVAGASSIGSAKSVQLVNPYPATGPQEISGSTPANKVLRAMQDHAVPPVTDLIGHSLQQSLARAFDTAVVVTRRSRRGGLEGREHVATAAPDGRSLLLGGTDVIVVLDLVSRHVAAPAKLAPVALIARMPMVLVAYGAASGVHGLIANAHAVPARRYLASSGDFSTSRLAAVLFVRASGSSYVQVPFNGAHPAVRAVIAQQVDAAFVPLPALLPYARNSRLRALAIAKDMRHAALPDVMTLAEAGVRGADVSAWYGLFAPAATPLAVIERISAAIAAERAAPFQVQFMEQHGLDATHLGPAAFADVIGADRRRWKSYLDETRLRSEFR